MGLIIVRGANGLTCHSVWGETKATTRHVQVRDHLRNEAVIQALGKANQIVLAIVESLSLSRPYEQFEYQNTGHFFNLKKAWRLLPFHCHVDKGLAHWGTFAYLNDQFAVFVEGVAIEFQHILYRIVNQDKLRLIFSLVNSWCSKYE